MREKIHRSQGVTLFIAVLVVSMLSLASLSISNIALKQVLIGGSVKSSQKAYVAADSGMECALYWDTHNYDNEGSLFNHTYSPETFTCGTGVVNDLGQVDDGGYDGVFDCVNSTTGEPYDDGLLTSEFEVDYDLLACSIVSIKKTCDGDKVNTVVSARGYNVGCASENFDSNRVVERAIQAVY
ncbi:MAG: pilus assembly PilX N-terminal domain-containing protein [Candidatus Paceibacterota bacterium]|jgi:hypothetical protein